jgi:hypothetical protein
MFATTLRYLMIAFYGILLVACAFPTPQETATSTTGERAVRQFLQKFAKEDLLNDPDIRYLLEFVDLNGDKKKEAIVYVIGQYICGRSGCPTLILTPQGSGYKLVTEISITNLPIRVLETTSHGWRDLEVRVVPGSLREDYEAVLHFDGMSYPENPSIPPAQPTDGKAPGHRLFDSSEEKRLADH